MCAHVHGHRGGVNELNPEDGVRPTGAGITSSCEPPHVGSGSELQPSTRQQTLLTTEPSLQPCYYISCVVRYATFTVHRGKYYLLLCA